MLGPGFTLLLAEAMVRCRKAAEEETVRLVCASATCATGEALSECTSTSGEQPATCLTSAASSVRRSGCASSSLSAARAAHVAYADSEAEKQKPPTEASECSSEPTSTSMHEGARPKCSEMPRPVLPSAPKESVSSTIR